MKILKYNFVNRLVITPNMRILSLTVTLLAVQSFFCGTAYAEIQIIPYPQHTSITEKVFDKSNLDKIRFVRTRTLPPEGYELQLGKGGVVVRYHDDAGRFYALGTLDQLAQADVMYCGTIKDAPRFQWRGFMLDESRHFFGTEKVKELLDLMARYKLNRFHWHLSDNQGWRVEIKAYPQLCKIGAVGCHTDRDAPARFYTQEQIREIIAYAAERHIEIIPEIDMPGHATAFVKAFAELDGGSHTVNPANPKLYTVLETIMKELAGLFPGRYIHIGGDEVSTKGWARLPEMPEFMKSNGIVSLSDIQPYFEKRLIEIVRKTGKTVIVWDEVIGGNPDKEGTIIQWWQADHPENLDKSLNEGYCTIVCPFEPFYLNYAQDSRCTKGPLVHKSFFNELNEVYGFPISGDPHILGVQCNLWTEQIRTSDRLDYMVFPRLIAIAEKAWTADNSLDYDSFIARLANEYSHLDSLGVFYFDFRDFDRHPEPLK